MQLAVSALEWKMSGNNCRAIGKKADTRKRRRVGSHREESRYQEKETGREP
jgi:hypothetical protein